MRKKDDHLRETLLQCARTLVDIKGIDCVSIRSIAQKADVSVGTVYNYFSNKDEILLALTQQYWEQALLSIKVKVTADSFCGQLEEIFALLKEEIAHSAGKLMSSLAHLDSAGEQHMTDMQASLERALIVRMEQDAHIRSDIWDDAFTKEELARFVMMHMTLALRMRANDIRFLIAMLHRTLY